MKPIKIAILGAGNIARKMADTIRQQPDVAIAYAVAARDLSRAQAFAQEYGFAKAYGSYAELAADPEVELVYIATTSDAHAAHMTLCLNAGKNVLCEKPFTANAAQARAVLSLAREKGLLAAEAIWPRYMPMAQTIREVCESGVIGKVHSLTANLGYDIAAKQRLQEPSLAGGAMLDVGVYALNFAAMVFGSDVSRLATAAVCTEKGVDAQSGITLVYPNGQLAVLMSSMLAFTDRYGIVHGDKGYMQVQDVNNPANIRVFSVNAARVYEQIAYYEAPPQQTGFEYELQAAAQAVRDHAIECPQMPHTEILKIMELLDELRAAWQVTYPCDLA